MTKQTYEDKNSTFTTRVPFALKRRWNPPTAFWDELTDSYIALIGHLTLSEAQNYLAQFPGISAFFDVLIARYKKDEK